MPGRDTVAPTSMGPPRRAGLPAVTLAAAAFLLFADAKLDDVRDPPPHNPCARRPHYPFNVRHSSGTCPAPAHPRDSPRSLHAAETCCDAVPIPGVRQPLQLLYQAVG